MASPKFVARGYESKNLARSILGIAEKVTLCTMATVNADRTSHINTAYVCYDSALRFYFISDVETQHGKNIAARPSLAVALFSTEHRWGKPISGLQLFGTCRRATGLAAAKALLLYGRRFHDYAKYARSLSKAQRLAGSFRFFVFTPTSLRLVDEPRFGEENFITVGIRR
jgi:uncharacterized protein YhbP (UPF0306 family)